MLLDDHVFGVPALHHNKQSAVHKNSKKIGFKEPIYVSSLIKQKLA